MDSEVQYLAFRCLGPLVGEVLLGVQVGSLGLQGL